MIKKSILAFFGLSTLALGSTVVVASNSLDMKNLKAVTPQTERRVWVVNNTGNGGEWYKWDDVQLVNVSHSNAEITAVKVVSDYYKGLFYFDVPSDTTTIILRGKENKSDGHNSFGWSDDGWQTVDYTLPTLNANSSDVIYVNGISSNVKRTPSKGSAPMSKAQLAWLMCYYDSCNPSYTYGYNAWKQLKYDFYDPSDIDKDNTYVTEDINERNHVTLAEKAAFMASRCEI